MATKSKIAQHSTSALFLIREACLYYYQVLKKKECNCDEQFLFVFLKKATQTVNHPKYSFQQKFIKR